MVEQVGEVDTVIGLGGVNVKGSLTAAGKASSIIKLSGSAVATPTETLKGHVQGFNVGERIELFAIDATGLKDINGIAGSIYRFTPMQYSGVPVVYRGVTFFPIAAVADGFSMDGQASPAQPKIRVSNVGNLMGSAVVEFGDLVGAICYRIRTFKRFLDGQPDADITAFFPMDIYTVNRKATHNKMMVEWELSAGIDQENVYLPARTVLKYTCTQSYRFWDPTLNGGAGGFNYTQATCPFNGSQNGNLYYNEAGVQVTSPSLDLCGRSDKDCRKRFINGGLQTWAFPGVGATQST